MKFLLIVAVLKATYIIPLQRKYLEVEIPPPSDFQQDDATIHCTKIELRKLDELISQC